MRRSLGCFALSLSLVVGCSSGNGGKGGVGGNGGGGGTPVVIPPDMATGAAGGGGAGGGGNGGGGGSAGADMTAPTSTDMATGPLDLAGIPLPDHDPTLHPPLPAFSNAKTNSPYTAPNVWTVVWTDPAAKYGDYGTQVNTFTSWMLGSAYWKTGTSEYGVGAGTAGGVIKIASAPPKTITDAQLQSLITKNVGITTGWPAKSANLIISFVIDPASTATTGGAQSCVYFDGYHSKTAAGIAYLVNAYCFLADGVTPDWDDLTVTISHEAAEATTDPDLNSNRVQIPGTTAVYEGGGETGDMCLAVNATIQATPTTSYMVQQLYSNATVAADNAAPTGPNTNPCVPSTDGPYFGAAFWSGDTSNSGQNQSVLAVTLASNGTGTGTFNIEPFEYDPSVGPIEFFVAGSFLPAGVTLDPDIAIRSDPSNPNGPPLGTRLWANAGSTIPIKVNFDSTYMNDGQPVQVLVVAETQSKRLNIWWASIQPK